MSALEESLYYLIDGLETWEIEKKHIPESLRRGHHSLSKLLMAEGIVPPADILTLLQLLQRPISEWGLASSEEAALQQPMVVPYVGVSSAAKEFKCFYTSPEEAHVREVLAILKYCRNSVPQLEEHYRKIRLFLIERPVVTFKDLLAFGLSLNDAELLRSLQNCYEDMTSDVSRYRKCPRCGWTLSRQHHEWRCGREDICGSLQSRDQVLEGWSSEVPMYRLKEGVYRYTMLPGLAEIGIAKRLVQNGFVTSMFPDVDQFDLKVEINRRVIKLDVKDFSSPMVLSKYFTEQPEYALQKYQQDGVYIVIPHYRIKRFPTYINLVKRLLGSHAKRLNIMDEKNILRMLEKEADRG